MKLFTFQAHMTRTMDENKLNVKYTNPFINNHHKKHKL